MKRFFNFSLILFTLAFIRFSDSVIKKTIFVEIKNRENELKELRFLKDSLEKELNEIVQKFELQNLKKELKELKNFYLELDRKNNVAYLKIEDKVLKKMNFEVFLQENFSLPKGILQVIAKQETTYFIIPDYYYELLGKKLPAKKERIIKNGLSPYLLSLGERLIICGPFSEEVPKDLINFNAIIFSLEDIKIIFHSLKENSKVIFY
ncbi:MAG: hypothetical protein N2323_04450 [candidate division WOR-3 bacterium]|nr:hypothetical protein [candidate division WOR-3 bacterium]MCX7837192.1 hypothetical protein [candidate division WOR-3 bacterium]MDW8113958.1 hypothetical protein [candidate division WOR-3 bacterium]